MAVEWSKVEKFAEAHWPYLVIGLIVIVGIFYTFGSSASTASNTSSAATGSVADTGTTTSPYDTGYYQTIGGLVSANNQDETQLAAAQIAGQVQTAIAQINASASVANTNASAATAAYTSVINATSNTSNVLAAALSGQNSQALQTLQSGFASYAGGLAQSVASDATAAAGVAEANDQVASQINQTAYNGAALITNALNQTGLLGRVNPTVGSNFVLLPSVGSSVNLTAPIVTSPGYVDNGTFQLAA